VKATRDRLIMPVDVELAPVGSFDPASLVGLEFAEGDWIVTRVASRSRSMIISADLAELFQSFRTPSTILDAVLQYARVHTLDPQTVLDNSWPVITRFLHANWLVPEHSYLSRDLAPWYEPGSSLMGHTVEACIHVADDTQVYRARTPSGDSAPSRWSTRPAVPTWPHCTRRDASSNAWAALRAHVSLVSAAMGGAGSR